MEGDEGGRGKGKKVVDIEQVQVRHEQRASLCRAAGGAEAGAGMWQGAGRPTRSPGGAAEQIKREREGEREGGPGGGDRGPGGWGWREQAKRTRARSGGCCVLARAGAGCGGGAGCRAQSAVRVTTDRACCAQGGEGATGEGRHKAKQGRSRAGRAHRRRGGAGREGWPPRLRARRRGGGKGGKGGGGRGVGGWTARGWDMATKVPAYQPQRQQQRLVLLHAAT